MRRGAYHRWMYRGGRPNVWARWQNRFGAWLFGRGVSPQRAVTLEVVGRRSGNTISFPLVMVDHGGAEYLVSMLGERAQWVANVRAAGGIARLRHGIDEDVRLVEVPVADRAPILARYVDVAPGGRPHIPVPRGAPLAAFAGIAADVPVFRVDRRP